MTRGRFRTWESLSQHAGIDVRTKCSLPHVVCTGCGAPGHRQVLIPGCEFSVLLPSRCQEWPRSPSLFLPVKMLGNFFWCKNISDSLWSKESGWFHSDQWHEPRRKTRGICDQIWKEYSVLPAYLVYKTQGELPAIPANLQKETRHG